jgi:hypothetical protein
LLLKRAAFSGKRKSLRWEESVPPILSPSLLLAFAGFRLVFSLSIWWVFLRPVPQKTAVGVITEKTYKPAGTYWQQPTGVGRSFWTPTRIPIAECFVFTVRLDGLPVEARVALNTVAARDFEIGQTVSIEYVERGLPLIWKRVYVRDMKHV